MCAPLILLRANVIEAPNQTLANVALEQMKCYRNGETVVENGFGSLSGSVRNRRTVGSGAFGQRGWGTGRAARVYLELLANSALRKLANSSASDAGPYGDFAFSPSR
jgi:hypothetical protein